MPPEKPSQLPGTLILLNNVVGQIIFFSIYLIFIGVELLYNVVLVSTVQRSESAILIGKAETETQM